MVIVCDICGTKNIGEPNYCTVCGVDLRESEEPGLEKKKDRRKKGEKRTPANQHDEKSIRETFRVIKWCWLKKYEMPHVLILMSMLAQGRSTLGFCDCAICNQGYREFIAFRENLDGNHVTSHSREIVLRARENDMSTISWNLSDLLLHYSIDDDETPESKSSQPVHKSVAREGKILVEIDEEIIENAVLKILQSEKGQHIIQESRAPRKKRTPKKR